METHSEILCVSYSWKKEIQQNGWTKKIQFPLCMNIAWLLNLSDDCRDCAADEE